MGVNHIRAACIFRHSVHFCLHVQQFLGPIYVDGAIRTAAAKVIPFTSQHAFELKCWGDATLGQGLISPQQVFPYAFRHLPLLARAHHLAHPRIPDGASFTYLGPHAGLQHFSKFLWSPIRPANLSCVPCFPVSFARVPGVHG